jgi:hypothetical protein
MKTLFATVAAIATLSVSTAAQASIIPTLLSLTPTGSDFTFNYVAFLSGDQGLVAGDVFAIFNFNGYVPGSISTTAPDFSVLATTGSDGLSLPPGFVLIPGDTTLVFTYTGPDYHTSGGPFPDTLLAKFSAESIDGGFSLGAYSAIAENNTGFATGTKAFNFGYTVVPFAIPEPGAWALMLIGAGLTGASLRGRRRAIRAA